MKELESSYKLGFKSASEIAAAMGKEYRDVITQKAEESAMRQVIAKEVGKKYGVEIEQRELLMLTPNEQAGQEKADDPEPTTKETPDDETN